jgi:hypothetical protein
MAVTHDTNTKNLIANAVCGANLNGGATLVLLTAGSLAVATIALDSTAFAAATGGSATANSFPKEATVANAGTITNFQIKDSGSIARIFGSVTVTGGGGDIQLSSVTYVIGEIIRINSLVYNVPN